MISVSELLASVRQGCASPGCGHKHGAIYLHARCHPSASTQTAIDADRGVLRVECTQCDAVVVEVNLRPS